MIITILGGSGQSTPVLIDSLARSVPNLPITWRLAGRNCDRLSAVQRACEILTKSCPIRFERFGEGEWRDAMTGSDVILVQARVGYYKGRQFDEQFPLEYSVPGDEGLGPGGLSAAYRAWPELRRLFEDIISCAPHAQAILLSSPVSLLVRLANVEFPGWPLIGTCELPFTTLMHLCSLFGTRWNEVSFEYAGVNHLGFLYDIKGGEDLVERYAQGSGSATFPSPDLVARLRAYPLKYLRMHYDQDAYVNEQRNRAESRAEQLALIAKSSFEEFRSGDEASIRRSLTLRRADWYEYAVVPLLLAKMGVPVAEPLFLTSASQTGEVLERAYRGTPEGIEKTTSLNKAPDHVTDLISKFAAYEQIAADAVLRDTTAAISEALLTHPWVKGGCECDLARRIVDQPRNYSMFTGDDLCLN